VRGDTVISDADPRHQKPTVGAGDRTSIPAKPEPAAGGFRSELVRNSVSEAGNADTYFELNKRQAGLNRLREAAGSNPDAAVRADLDEIQARLNANRLLLDQRSKIADRHVTEILRAGLAPVDTVAGAINLLSGDGELRDVLAMGGAVPLVGTVSKLGKLATTGRIAAEAAEKPARGIIQLGGAHRRVKGLPGYEAHHMPGNKVSPLSRGGGPAIAMLKEDHRAILTSANSKRAKAFRAVQREHIARGDFAAAMQMDIDHVRSLFGNKYDDVIEQALKYVREQGFTQ